MKQETEVLKALRAQLMLQGVVCTLGVGGTVEEQDVVTTASKGGQHRGVFDRITGQLLDLVGVEIPREDEMTYERRLKVFEYASEEHVREVTGKAPMWVDWVDVNKGD